MHGRLPVLPLGYLPAPSLGLLPRRVQLGSSGVMLRRVLVVDLGPLCTSRTHVGTALHPWCSWRQGKSGKERGGMRAPELDAKCKFKKECESPLSE